MKKVLFIAFFGLLFAAPASGIIIRHDRDDAQYRALGAKYAAVGFVGRDGESVLIAPEWVLTAAHVAADIPAGARHIIFGNKPYPIASVFLHPEWKQSPQNDIALIKLAEPVKTITPVALYTEKDEAGKIVTFVGRGDTGTGLTGPTKMDKQVRGATNKVDNADNQWVYFSFDDPATATELEGISGPGDSGGPALIERDGKLYTLGVSIAGAPGKNGRGTYGAKEFYTRVSLYIDWIKQTLSGATVSSMPAKDAPVAQVAATSQAANLPDTPTGRRVAAYLKAFSTGDADVMRQFFTDNFTAGVPIEDRLARYKQISSDLGKLELRRVVQVTDDSITIIVQAAGGDALQFQFDFEAPPSSRIKGIRAQNAGEEMATAPSIEVKAPASEAELVGAVDGYFKKLVDADEFSGAVLVAKQGKPVYQKAFGLASKEFNVPNRLDTKFNTGSIDKSYTQIAIGQLIEQGKLAADDTIGKHLPDYPNKQAAEKITILHLLTHTSGIGDFFNERYFATPKNQLRNIADFLKLIADKPLEFEPGARQRYSNGGYAVLGAIIEKVSGQSYYDYVREHIFKPAGMMSTDFYEADVPTPNLARGYTRRGNPNGGEDKERKSNLLILPARGSSAGGGYSTVEDLLKFSLAVQNATLLSPAMTRWALNERTEKPPVKGAAPAASQPGQPGGMGIAGGAPGLNAALEADSQSGYTVIVMSNYDPPTAERAAMQIMRWIGQFSR